MKKFAYVALALAIQVSIVKPAEAGIFKFNWDEIVEVGQEIGIDENILEVGSEIDQILSNPEQELDRFLQNALDYTINVLAMPIDNDCPEILRIVPGPCPSGAGGTGIPTIDNLPKTSGGFRTTSFPGVDFFTSNSVVIERDFANLYDQEYARAQAARIMGEAGADWLNQNVATTTVLLQENDLLVQEVAELTQEAETLEVTQDVMKNSIQVQSNMAKIAQNQSRLNATLQASLLSLQQQQASLMQLNANLGEAFDEANRRGRLEREAVYLEGGRSLVYIPGFEW